MNNRIGNALGKLAVVALLTIAFIFALKHFASTSYVTYYESNDGYIPVEFSPCEVIATRERENSREREITVTFNGNEYSCYVTSESEIRKGDTIWAGFAYYEGNLEFVDIH